MVQINKCGQCRYRDHSGYFTPGGAKNICQGPNVIEHVARYKDIFCPPNYIKHLNDSNSRYHKDAINYIHWMHRVITDKNEIPE